MRQARSKIAPQTRFAERRKARRYIVNFSAKAALQLDQPTRCTVRNISSLGALLEFDTPVLVPKRFRISIDNPHFTADCELRHRSEKTVGVMFISNRADAHALFS